MRSLPRDGKLAARTVLGEPFILTLDADTPDQIAAMCVAEFEFRYGTKVARAAMDEALQRARQGRPARQGLEPREQRLLILYDTWPRRPDGRPDNKGFAARFRDELSPHSPEAAEKKLSRLLQVRGDALA